jgi:hypothetical protein
VAVSRSACARPVFYEVCCGSAQPFGCADGLVVDACCITTSQQRHHHPHHHVVDASGCRVGEILEVTLQAGAGTPRCVCFMLGLLLGASVDGFVVWLRCAGAQR